MPKIGQVWHFTGWLRQSVTTVVAGLLFAQPLHAADDALPLHLIADVPLSGRATRFDYESVAPDSHRLYIAHLGDSSVTVFDTNTQKVIGDISGIGHVHGVLRIASLSRIYASATQTNEVVAIDEKSLLIEARMPGGIYPDGMAYAPEVHRLYVSDETGLTESVIDTETEKLIATIPLGSVAGNSQFDSISKHIFVAGQSLNQLIEIDPEKNRIIARYDLSEADGPHGLYIDPDSRQAFVACEGNNLLVVFDLISMRVTSSFPVGGDPDVLAFDSELHRLYVAGEKGVVSVFSVVHGDTQKLGEGFVGPNAHVVAVDQQTHRVYFPLKDLRGGPALRIMEPVKEMPR